MWINQRALLDDLQFFKIRFQGLSKLPQCEHILGVETFSEGLAKLITTLYQIRQGDSFIDPIFVNLSSVHKSDAPQLFLSIRLVDDNFHEQIASLNQATFSLYDLHGLYELLTCELKDLNIVIKGKHVIKVLILDETWHPFSPKSPRVDQGEIWRVLCSCFK